MKGQVYIVTGGGKGFGFAIAKALVSKGAAVAITGRTESRLNKAVEELGADQCIGLVLDVTNESELVRGYSDVKSRFGRLDGVVNNAGVAYPGAADAIVTEELLEQLNTNFAGTVLSCKAAIPLLRGGVNPRIINISSASAVHMGQAAHLSVYAASKSAVERYSFEIRNELQFEGIGVTVIRPGAAATEFSAGWDSDTYLSSLRAWVDQGKYMDVGMEPGHVADSVVWALQSPVGVSIDLLEVRPNIPLEKPDPEVLLGLKQG